VNGYLSITNIASNMPKRNKKSSLFFQTRPQSHTIMKVDNSAELGIPVTVCHVMPPLQLSPPSLIYALY